MDPGAQRVFLIGAGLQLGSILIVGVLLPGPLVETYVTLVGCVTGVLVALQFSVDDAVRSWEDGAFYGGGAAAISMLLYLGVKSTYSTYYYWHTRNVFAPINIFFAQYVFGVWLVVITFAEGFIVGAISYPVLIWMARIATGD